MKENYIPKDKRKKILLLGDDMRSHSGVGTQMKNIVLSTAHHFNFIQIGSAQNHPENGKRFDLSDNINKEIGIKDSSVFIHANNKYGDASLIRQIIKAEKPNAIFFFTDPRYYDWLFRMEHEIRSQGIPLIYYNIWDDVPYPFWNRPFYRSCDQLLAISKQTKNINEQVLRDYPKDDWAIKHTPHGILENEFYPIDEKEHPNAYASMQQTKKTMFNNEDIDFMLFFNSRNIRRKNIPDLILAWRLFTDNLPQDEAKKCRLLLHTTPVDPNGTDLYAVIESLCNSEQNLVLLSGNPLPVQKLNEFYNLADYSILVTDNEGHGLSLSESLITGTPIIAPVQGGMQDMLGFKDEKGEWLNFREDYPTNAEGKYKNHGEWAIPIFPQTRSIKGSPPTPYIYASQVSIDDIVIAIAKAYYMSKEERQKRGAKGREFALKNYSGTNLGKNIINNIDKCLENFKPKPRYEILNSNVNFNVYQKYPMELSQETKCELLNLMNEVK